MPDNHETPAARLERLLEEEARSEWAVSDSVDYYRVVNTAGDTKQGPWTIGAIQWKSHAEFIVSAHNDLPAILSRLRALEEALELIARRWPGDPADIARAALEGKP